MQLRISAPTRSPQLGPALVGGPSIAFALGAEAYPDETLLSVDREHPPRWGRLTFDACGCGPFE